MSNNSKVYIRNIPDEDTMKITYGCQDIPDQTFTFVRPKEEALSATLLRMKNKIQKSVTGKILRKNKKEKQCYDNMELSTINMALLKNGNILEQEINNANAWISGNQLQINDKLYDMILNPPTILHLSLPKHIMSSFLVYPKINFEFCSKDDSLFIWHRLKLNSSQNHDDETENGIPISKDFFYTTCVDDIGHNLKITCIPKHGEVCGIEQSFISSCIVQPGPRRCPFEDRHRYTEDLTNPGSMRLVSYNILADLYADTDTARNEFFAHCPPEVLALDYRRQLYLKEIMGYNGDIICLQEVDRKVFYDDLVPVLSISGLQGIYSEKGGQVVEGLACFYRSSKFKLIESNSIILCDAVKRESCLKNLLLKITEKKKLANRFMIRSNALQTLLLESLDTPGKRIIVGNTHLYYRPQSANIKLLQTACCLQYLEMLLQKYKNKDPSHDISLIFCGDFNSCPDSGVYSLINTGFLPHNCPDWKSRPGEVVTGIDLSHSLKLDSACGTPEYTNYTEGFFGCIDYIFHDKTFFTVSDRVPFPTHKQVTKYKALPNRVFPSDHIALVCTLKLEMNYH